jgi:hypothetical protein
MNTVSTGNSIAAAIEPNDTNLVNAININANTKQINPICQFVINSTPRDVATPFPPLNLKNTGKAKHIRIFLMPGVRKAIRS